MAKVEKPIVVIDTNIIYRALIGGYAESRILKDSREGDSFNYMITKAQILDVKNSKELLRNGYSSKILEVIEKCNLDLMAARKYYDTTIRRILKMAKGIEKSDIMMVEDAVHGRARYLVSNDGHLTWKEINRVWGATSSAIFGLDDMAPLSFYTAKQFCEHCDDKIVKLTRFDKLKNRFRSFMG